MSDERIVLGHGSGGTLMHDLIDSTILRHFPAQDSAGLVDAVAVWSPMDHVLFTTDSFVVSPQEFPGGNIGHLAVCGTVNDLAVMGAKPVALSCGLIVEEGLELSFLERVLASMADMAKAAGVPIVTGDTKVVERGAVDKIFINTSGVGHPVYHLPGLDAVKPGDAIIVNGPLGQHGATVMAAREGIADLGDLRSDVAPLWGLVDTLLKEHVGVRLMRDPTRGGLATTLNEFVAQKPFGISLDETAFPRDAAVEAYCDALGLDPLYVANEGKVVMAVAPEDAQRAVEILRSHPHGGGAAVIGSVVDDPPGRVVLTTAMGGKRYVTMLAGEQLPRIC